MKKKIAISILLSVFGLMLSHQIIPHHHHNKDEPIAHEHKHAHDHDGQSNHHHNLLDVFFSMLHHVDEGSTLYVHTEIENRLRLDVLHSSALGSVSHEFETSSNSYSGLILRPFAHWGNPFALTAHGLRGPPLA